MRAACACAHVCVFSPYALFGLDLARPFLQKCKTHGCLCAALQFFGNALPAILDLWLASPSSVCWARSTEGKSVPLADGHATPTTGLVTEKLTLSPGFASARPNKLLRRHHSLRPQRAPALFCTLVRVTHGVQPGCLREADVRQDAVQEIMILPAASAESV
eukprot:329107-Chlamydomonas_euryale.AAC.6